MNDDNAATRERRPSIDLPRHRCPPFHSVPPLVLLQVHDNEYLDPQGAAVSVYHCSAFHSQVHVVEEELGPIYILCDKIWGNAAYCGKILSRRDVKWSIHHKS